MNIYLKALGSLGRSREELTDLLDELEDEIDLGGELYALVGDAVSQLDELIEYTMERARDE